MNNRTSSDSMKEIKGFLIALLVVVVVAGGVYLLTGKFVTKDLFKEKEKKTTEVTFSYDKTLIGSMFKKPYDEYYVVIYDASSDGAMQIAGIMSKYDSKSEKLKVYVADLSLDVNKSYYNIASNPKAKTIEDIKVRDYTLIKFKDGKISKYVEGIENISSELK